MNNDFQALDQSVLSRRTLLIAAIGCSMAPLLAVAAEPIRSSSEPASGFDAIHAFLTGFISDFENLDWPKFRERFADESTVFFPPRFSTELAAGREETDHAWNNVFTKIRALSGRSVAPFMRLQPVDLKIERWGPTAVVTFTLGVKGEPIDRRTLVLRESSQKWLIVHLHGSTIAAS